MNLRLKPYENAELAVQKTFHPKSCILFIMTNIVLNFFFHQKIMWKKNIAITKIKSQSCFMAKNDELQIREQLKMSQGYPHFKTHLFLLLEYQFWRSLIKGSLKWYLLSLPVLLLLLFWCELLLLLTCLLLVLVFLALWPLPDWDLLPWLVTLWPGWSSLSWLDWKAVVLADDDDDDDEVSPLSGKAERRTWMRLVLRISQSICIISTWSLPWSWLPDE